MAVFFVPSQLACTGCRHEKGHRVGGLLVGVGQLVS